MSIESVLITATTDAHEGRNVGICNIPDTFISAYTDEDVKLALQGRLLELMVNISPQIYIQHVISKNIRPFLNITLKMTSLAA